MSIIKSNTGILQNSNKIIRQNWDIAGGLKTDGVNDYVKSTNNCPLLAFLVNAEFSISVISTYAVNSYNVFYVFGNNFPSSGVIDFSQFDNEHRIWLNICQISPSNRMYLGFNYNPLLLQAVNNFTIVKTTSLNANGVKCYLNGIELTSKFIEHNTLRSMSYIDNNYRIGSYESTYVTSQIIYDLKVFNKELTQQEATELYLKKGQIIPSSIPQSNVILDMRFDDKSGTIAKDQSGNNYHGTLVNYAVGTTDLGVNNSWKNKYGNAITQY